MKNILVILGFLFLLFSANLLAQQDSSSSTGLQTQKEEPKNEPANSFFNFNPSLGFTYLNTSKTDDFHENLQWLAKLNARYSYEGKSFQLNSSMLAQYGQIHTKGAPPEKYQDDFIFTLTPSITMISKPAIRLFLETTAETDLGEGMIGKRKTAFTDPLFLYQTLFVGQKQFLITSTDKENFEITYGIGYAFQQTLTKDFTVDTLAGSGQTTFESGISAVFQIDATAELAKNMKYKLSMKSMAFSKKDFFKDINSSRGSVLLSTGLFYSVIGVEYNLHMVYDKNFSPVRQLEQSLMLSFNLDL